MQKKEAEKTDFARDSKGFFKTHFGPEEPVNQFLNQRKREFQLAV